MRSFRFLVNPTSGGGAGPDAAAAVAALLTSSGASVSIVPTTSSVEVAGLVASAVAAGEVVVSVGGDGMLSSIAGAVSAVGGTLGMVPAGRGNDFARMLGLPSSPVDLASLLLTGSPRSIDLLSCGDRVVAGSVYAGVDAAAGHVVDRVRWMPSRLQYPYAAVRSLATYRPASFSVTVDGATTSYEAASVVVANSGYYGKGMHIAPSACVEDGLLDVVVIPGRSRLELIRNMPKVYDGRHVDLPSVVVLRGRSVSLTAAAPVPVGGDGESLGAVSASEPVSVSVLPGVLSVLA